MLTGKNIVLRPLRLSDAEHLNRWRNDVENKIMTQGFRLPVALERDMEWIKSKVLSSGNSELYCIIEKSEKPIGMIQLTEIDYISGTARWGFILGDAAGRGKGYGVEAPLLLFNYAFNILNLRKLYSYNVGCNKATFKMHQKIGPVKEEGCLKSHYFYNGTYWDMHILSFFKEDFQHLSAASIVKGA